MGNHQPNLLEKWYTVKMRLVFYCIIVSYVYSCLIYIIIESIFALFQPPGFAGPISEMPDPPEIPDDLKNECKVT